ncbi:MAG: hypothetical protein M0001_03720 [Treponema sp.]|nr:hypothetical protein [Treponema sp.]
MPRVKASYTLYQRPRSTGKPVWYFQAYDEQGKRLPGASAFRTITSEACRLALIADDPWKRVPLFVGDSKPRDILTTREAITLMNPATVEQV